MKMRLHGTAAFLLAAALTFTSLPLPSYAAEEVPVSETADTSAPGTTEETEEVPAPSTDEVPEEAEEEEVPAAEEEVPAAEEEVPAAEEEVPAAEEEAPAAEEEAPAANAIEAEEEITETEDAEAETATALAANEVASGEVTKNNLAWKITGSAGNYTLTVESMGDNGNSSDKARVGGVDRFPDDVYDPGIIHQNTPWAAYVDGITEIVIGEKIFFLDTAAFAGLKNLRKVTFAERHGDTMSFAPFVFAECPSLTQFEIPPFVNYLQGNAFYLSPNVTVTLAPGNNQLQIIDDVLYRVGSMERVVDGVIKKDGMELVCILPQRKSKVYHMPEQVISTALYAAYGNPYLEEVTFSAYLEIVDKYSFYGTKIREAVFGDKELYVSTAAFAECRELKRVIFTDSALRIANYAFQNCVSLEELKLSAHLGYLGYDVLENCASLKELTVPGGAGIFYYYSLYGCTALETLRLEEGITSLNGGGKWDIQHELLPSLKTVYLPVSLKSIYGVFTPSSVIETVYYAGTPRMWEGVSKGNGTERLSDGSIEIHFADGNYTLRFDPNADDAQGSMEDMICPPDELIELPESTFERPGYHFTGWAVTNIVSPLTDTAIVYPAGYRTKNLGNRTLYARWEANHVTIRFDANGGSGTVYPFSVDCSDKNTMAYSLLRYTSPNEPERPGHAFVGWFKTAMEPMTLEEYEAVFEQALTTVGEAVANAGHNEEVTLYAGWVRVDQYHVNVSLINTPLFYTEIPKWDYGQNRFIHDGMELRYRTAYNPETGKYEDINMYHSAEGMPAGLMPYAHYTVPQRYVFEGWFSDAALKKQIFEIEPGTTGDITLYPKFTPKKYVVSFDGNADGKLYDIGTGALMDETSEAKVQGSIKPMTVTFDRDSRIPANAFKREGYLFAGFGVLDPEGALKAVLRPGDGTVKALDPYVTLKEEELLSVTLHALWTKDGNVVTFDSGEGTLDADSLTGFTLTGPAQETQATIRLAEGDALKADMLPAATRPGYTFTGWYQDEACKKRIKTLAFSKTAATRTLYAGYKINTVTLKFTTGDNPSAKAKMKSVKLSGVTEYKLPACTMPNEHGLFRYWTLSTDDFKTHYNRDDTVTIVAEKDRQVIEVRGNWEQSNYSFYIWPGWGYGYAGFDEEGEPDMERIGEDFESFPIDGKWNSGELHGYYQYRKDPVGRKLPKLTAEPLPDGRQYVFSHWVVFFWQNGKQVQKKVTSIPASVSGNVTLEAVWKLKNASAGYIYYADGTDEVDVSAADKDGNVAGCVKQKVTEGKNVKLRTKPVSNAMEKAGYALVGWSDGEPVVMSGTEAYVADTVRRNGNVYIFRPGETETFESREGFGTVLYPVYARRFQVTLDPGSGYFFSGSFVNGADAPLQFTYDYNEGVSAEIMKSYQPVREGYTFAGWSYKDEAGRTKVLKGAIPKTMNRPLYLTAVWKALPMKIVYHHNVPKTDPAYKLVRGRMSAQKIVFEGVPVALKKNTFKVKGYRFVGWSDTEGGYLNSNFTVGGKKTYDGSSIYLPSVYSPEVHLYAKWKKESYSIRYQGLYRDTHEFEGPHTFRSVYYVDSPTYVIPAPSRAGYVFQGWYTDAKYKKKITQIKQGTIGDITLYAKWKKL